MVETLIGKFKGRMGSRPSLKNGTNLEVAKVCSSAERYRKFRLRIRETYSILVFANKANESLVIVLERNESSLLFNTAPPPVFEPIVLCKE